jgi:hypothetical protein
MYGKLLRVEDPLNETELQVHGAGEAAVISASSGNATAKADAAEEGRQLIKVCLRGDNTASKHACLGAQGMQKSEKRKMKQFEHITDRSSDLRGSSR